ncbi:unnamed protein product [Closterium sp. NIES-54]
MDVWGPALVNGQDLRLQLRERFREDLFVLRLHSDRGGEFSFDLLQDFCRGEGILQSFTLPASPQQNRVAECRIGLVMEVIRTSMIHAAAPHLLWLFAVRYAAHQLNLWPRVSLPETSPTLRWKGKVGDASVFRVWGSRAFVRDTSADKLFSRAIPCDVTFDESVPFYRLFPYRTAPLPPSPLFLGPGPPQVDPLPPHGPAPSCLSQVDPLPLAEHIESAVDSGAARGAASGGADSGGAEHASAEPGGAESEGAEPGGAESEGAESGGAEPEGAEPGGTEPEGAEPGGAEYEGAEFVGAEPGGNTYAEGPVGASPRLSHRREPLSPQQLREWFAQRTRLRSGAAGAGGPATGGCRAGGAGATSPRGAGVTGGAGGTGGAGAAGPGGARTRGTGGAGAGGVGGSCTRAGGTGARGVGASSPGGAGVTDGAKGTGGAGAAGPGGARTQRTRAARVGDPGAGGAGTGGARVGAGGTMQRRPFFVPPPLSSLPPPDSVLRQVLSLPSSTGLTPSLLCPPPHQLQTQLQPDSPLPAPSSYAEQTDSLTEHREPESRPASPACAVRTGHRVPLPRPPPVPGTHIMTLRPSSVPLRVPLQSPPASSLADGPDPESDLARAATPTVRRLLATVVSDPSFESIAASALVAELVEFAAACRLDYAASLVAESESDCPPSVGGECALGTDVLEARQKDFECLVAVVPHLVAMLLAPEGDPDAPDIPTPRSYAETITGPYSSQWQKTMDAKMAS